MGMNSQIHLTIETYELDKLRKEAEESELSVAELIRRKLSNPPTDREVLELRRLKEVFKGGKNGKNWNTTKRLSYWNYRGLSKVP